MVRATLVSQYPVRSIQETHKECQQCLVCFFDFQRKATKGYGAAFCKAMEEQLLTLEVVVTVTQGLNTHIEKLSYLKEDDTFYTEVQAVTFMTSLIEQTGN